MPRAGLFTARFGAMALFLALALSASISSSHAADYPERAITLIVPSPPGGGTDTAWRIIAAKLGEALRQTIIVENRPGASGNIGAAAVAKAEPDGYTLLALISSHVINPHLLTQVPYDLERDFIPISRVVTVPGVLISHPALGQHDLKELIAFAGAHPGKITFGSAGVGSTSHLIMEMLAIRAGVKLVHVPYRGTAPALADVLGNHVDLMVPDLSIAIGNIRDNRLRAYGVTSAERSPSAPEIPTLAEAGLPGFEALQWFGLAAPARTPRPIIDKLHAAVTRTLGDSDIRARLLKEAMTPAPSASPEDFAAFMRAEGSTWAKVIEDANIAAQ